MSTLQLRKRETALQEIPEYDIPEPQLPDFYDPNDRSFVSQEVQMTKGELLVILTSFGLSRQEIAPLLGVQARAIDSAMNRNPDLQEAVRAARKQADIQVVNALFRRAVGYNYAEMLYDNYGKIVRKVFKHLPPDVTAIIFWLKNRMKDEWADTFKGELTLRDRMDLGNRELAAKTEAK